MSQLTHRPSGSRAGLWLGVVAVVATGLNAAKPMRVDDAAYWSYAAQWARHPADPYGFAAFWTQHPVAANRLLCPPVLPLWWSLGMRLFGPAAVVAWKLWLFPWLATLVWAVYRLARRFAPGVAVPLTAAVALSPGVLPAINLMLDVPALAAGLAGLCLGLSAVDRRSVRLALAAGVVFGLAMQTKYTAVTFPLAVMLYAGAGRRGWWTAAVSAVPGAVAVALFAAWEAWVAHRYGASHFMNSLRGLDAGARMSPWFTGASVVPLVGCLVPTVGLAALVALDVPPTALAVAAVAVAAAYFAEWFVTVSTATFSVVGVGVWAAVLACGRPLWRATDPGHRRDTLFLFAWLGMETVAMVGMSPFPAARRVMAITVILTLIVGRTLTAVPGPSRTGRWLPAVWAAGLVLGLAFAALDLGAARAEVRAVGSVTAIVNRGRAPGQTVWFTGHWGLQFYGPLAGFRPILPDRSKIHRGDWLVLTRYGLATQEIALPPGRTSDVADVTVNDTPPLTTTPYYGYPVPLLHRDAPQVWLQVLRATADFVPASPP